MNKILKSKLAALLLGALLGSAMSQGYHDYQDKKLWHGVFITHTNLKELLEKPAKIGSFDSLESCLNVGNYIRRRVGDDVNVDYKCRRDCTEVLSGKGKVCKENIKLKSRGDQ
ncbi:hypothetical protein [Pseudobacteriovorax antillogorgiicola]|uniref:Beta/Gamma crystallin n=1 Tax=Pseudobacteriovorax antillogorgiicola TaxID=1513793 RepID=A0A1Y6C3P3_9BACT|nr:hypothetical protein [Pseudobacteriovorax antillogorgiicola]TCS50783.1 hypothetical protein EDD56_112166 [Pseudobacteriovorax antillogorgiicola]SMF41463.1 hypothetical protein SAMN06296036_112165 [Pseudobacteriovorax antillogorgiicola]